MSSATLSLFKQLAGKRVLITVGISAVMTGLLLWKASSYAPDTSRLQELQTLPFALAVTFAVANNLLAVARWRTILEAVGVRLPFFDCLTIVLAIFPLGLVTPFRASDLLRGVAVRHHIALNRGIGSVVVEKLVDVPVLTSMAAIGAFVLGRPAIGLAVLVGAVGITFSAFWLARERLALPFGLPASVAAKVELLRTPLQVFLADNGRVAVTVAYSAAGWFTNIMIVYCLLYAVGAPMALAQVMAAWPLSLLVGLLPITLAGVGTRDAAFLLFSRVPPHLSAQVLTASLLYFALTYLVVSAVGLAFVPRLIRNDPTFGSDAAAARRTR